MKHYIAIDWGATSGRVIVASVDELNPENIHLEEVHRFSHAIREGEDGHFYWDFTGLLRESVEGLKKAALLGHHYESVGVDTWGVDVVFYDAEGRMLAEPLAYRDPFTTDVPAHFFDHYLTADQLYHTTGIQLMHFNTVFKLFACRLENYAPYQSAHQILFLPDAVNYYLTGRMACEYTDLSTSAMMNPRTRDFDPDILSACGLSRSQFPDIVFPGHDLGLLRPDILAATGLNPDCRVTVVAGHDTGSAVAACPRTTINPSSDAVATSSDAVATPSSPAATSSDAVATSSSSAATSPPHLAFLSSGTWSLMGCVTDEPIITEESARLNFTNEGGVAGTTRLLKNITGMWILEQCRREWKAQGKDYSHPELIQMAQSIQMPQSSDAVATSSSSAASSSDAVATSSSSAATSSDAVATSSSSAATSSDAVASSSASAPHQATQSPHQLFNPDDPRFANPASMLAEVRNGRDLTDAEVVWTIYHSLAHRYGEVFRMLQSLAPYEIGGLYVIGGGVQNRYLLQLTEQAVGVPVIAGTTEATALGNIHIQMNK